MVEIEPTGHVAGTSRIGRRKCCYLPLGAIPCFKRTFKICSQPLNWTELKFSTRVFQWSVHSTGTVWAPTDLVCCSSSSRAADASNQWTRRVTGSTCCRSVEFMCCEQAFTYLLTCWWLGEREDVQKKTFTKWINARLTSWPRPLWPRPQLSIISDLYEDLRDGTHLLALLQTLTAIPLVSLVCIYLQTVGDYVGY